MNAFLPEYVADKGEGLHRRSLYTFWRRTSPPPNMLAFDAPSREVCVVRRQTTSTPLQPLVLLNDPAVRRGRPRTGRANAVRGGHPGRGPGLCVPLSPPRDGQPNANCVSSSALYQEQRRMFRADHEATQKFLKIGERPVPPMIDPAALAAATATASAILNLDASVTTR